MSLYTDSMHTVLVVVLIALIAFVAFALCRHDDLNVHDKHHAQIIAQQLQEHYDDVPEVNTLEGHNILAASLPMVRSEGYGDDTWRYLYYTDMWPASDWPPGIYNLKRWTPPGYVHPSREWFFKPGLYLHYGPGGRLGRWVRYRSGFYYSA